MMKSLSIVWLIVCLAAVFLMASSASAEVYQYQDAHGNWVFTDTPPADAGETAIPMEGMVERLEGARDLKDALEKKFAPKNSLDAAALATVTVTSAIGTGSGFFISENGFLLTNRHVIRGDARQNQAMKDAMAQMEDRITAAQREFEITGKQLAREREILSEMEAVMEKQPPGSAQRQTLWNQYLDRLAYYQAVKKDLEEKQAGFERQRDQFKTEKSDYESRQAQAGISRNFEITLKSGEILHAWLVRVSKAHDLALLKVDGCKTPYIPAADGDSAAQRQTVFAIGSPLNFADTVQNGIVTGFSKGFIQTNAPIYPGNSGGPLVNESGQVIGINTFKELTRNFEGMGFAIPIGTALDEFAGELR